MSIRFEGASRRRPGRHAIPRLRERILSSAVELFAHNGFDKVTADQVAARARVGKGSIYRQFGSKEGLYTAAIIVGFGQLRNQIERALEQELSFPDRIAAIVHHILSYVWDRGDFFALLRDPGAILLDATEQYRRERQQLSLLISKVLSEGAAAGLIRGDLNFQLVAESILGMIRAVRRHRSKELTVQEGMRTIVAVLLEGCIEDQKMRDSQPGGRRSSRMNPVHVVP